jgi:hypothetical protein
VTHSGAFLRRTGETTASRKTKVIDSVCSAPAISGTAVEATVEGPVKSNVIG